MPHSSNIIISDTSCLILLDRINELELLQKIANHVFVTPIVQIEFGKELPHWIEIKKPGDLLYQTILEMDLDKGEASAIALAMDLKNSILIIDELKGRRVAEKLKLRFSGTLGVILMAKQKGIIPAVTPIINKIKQTNFRLSEQVVKHLLIQAGE